jgi:hypothetical protein
MLYRNMITISNTNYMQTPTGWFMLTPIGWTPVPSPVVATPRIVAAVPAFSLMTGSSHVGAGSHRTPTPSPTPSPIHNCTGDRTTCNRSVVARATSISCTVHRCGANIPHGTMYCCDHLYLTHASGGHASGGHTSGGVGCSGHTSGSRTSGGHTGDRHASGGHTSGGHTSGGVGCGEHTSGSRTSGGHTGDRHASGGHTSGRHTSGGHTSGGHTSGGHVGCGGHASDGHASGGHPSVSGGHASVSGGGHVATSRGLHFDTFGGKYCSGDVKTCNGTTTLKGWDNCLIHGCGAGIPPGTQYCCLHRRHVGHTHPSGPGIVLGRVSKRL